MAAPDELGDTDGRERHPVLVVLDLARNTDLHGGTIAVPPPAHGVPRAAGRRLIIVRLGITLPHFGDAVDEAERLGDVAAGAEEAGAARLWVGDRLAAVDPKIGDGGTDTIPVEFRRALDPFAHAAGDQRGLRARRSSEPRVRCDT